MGGGEAVDIHVLVSSQTFNTTILFQNQLIGQNKNIHPAGIIALVTPLKTLADETEH